MFIWLRAAYGVQTMASHYPPPMEVQHFTTSIHFAHTYETERITHHYTYQPCLSPFFAPSLIRKHADGRSPKLFI